MARTTGKSGFKMRSGNKPTFAKMGSSAVNLRTFGIGKGTSPYKETDYAAMQEKSAELDPRYADMSPEEYEKEVKRQVEMKKKTGSYDAKNAFSGKNTEGKKSDEKITNIDPSSENRDVSDAVGKPETQDKKGGKKKALGKIFNALGKIGASALTGGLDAVYGTGKVKFAGGGTKLEYSKDKKKKDDETGEERVDKLIGKK